MGRNLPLCLEREWYSLRDIQEVFSISRESIASLLLDAENHGSPVRVAVLDFRSHPLIERKRPFVRVERRSLVSYLSEHCGVPRTKKENSSWTEWISPRDVEKIYGFSKESLKRILKDAEWKGIPIQTMSLPFSNGAKERGRSPRYLVERRSMNGYLDAHLATLSGWRKWSDSSERGD